MAPNFVSLNIAGSQTNTLEFDDETPEIRFLDSAFRGHLLSMCSGDATKVSEIYKLVNNLDKNYSTERFAAQYNNLPSWFITDTSLTFEEFKISWFANYDALNSFSSICSCLKRQS